MRLWLTLGDIDRVELEFHRDYINDYGNVFNTEPDYKEKSKILDFILNDEDDAKNRYRTDRYNDMLSISQNNTYFIIWSCFIIWKPLYYFLDNNNITS